MDRPATNSKISLFTLLIGLVFLIVSGCQNAPPMPTRADLAPTVELAAPTLTPPALAAVPATWTAVPPDQNAVPAAPTRTPHATGTPRSTATPTATFPPSKTPTATITPTPTAVPPSDTPTLPPPPTTPPNLEDPVWGGNLLPNSSFEEGDYLQNGVSELQLPNGWAFEYDTGPTGFGVEVWDVYVRPEVRVLPQDMLPPQEHALFIWDGSHTVKAFKGNGAISFRLFRDVYLEPGAYLLEINVFPDLVMAWNGDQKIWADDPESGEVRLIAPGSGAWMRPTFGRKNTFTYIFTIEQAQNVRLGAGIRGNHAIANDGWFLDDWSLRRAEN